MNTIILTIAITGGLALGFIRELQLINQLGLSGLLDALLVALFLPESIRLILNGGVLSAAWMPLWLQCKTPEARHHWSGNHSQFLLISSLLLSGLLYLASDWVVFTIGPGLDEANHQSAQEFLKIVVWVLPLLSLHALLSVIHQAENRFLLQGLGSLLFNLPVVLYLLLKDMHNIFELAYYFLLGGVIMVIPLIGFAWKKHWRPWSRHWDINMLTRSFKKVGPITLSGAATHLVVWVERIVLSLMGEGYIAMVNLARKLTNVLAVVLISAGQVLMSKLSTHFQQGKDQAAKIFSDSTLWLLTLSWPASLAAVIFNFPLFSWLPFDMDSAQQASVSQLFSGFILVLPLAAMNMLFARWCYAQSQTLRPTLIELACIGLQIALILVLQPIIHIWSIVVANGVGLLVMNLIFIGLGIVPIQPKLRYGMIIGGLMTSTLITAYWTNAGDLSPWLALLCSGTLFMILSVILWKFLPKLLFAMPKQA